MAIPEQPGQVQLTASPDGRGTIPAQLRRAAGIESGRRLVAYIDDGRVVLEEWNHLLRRVQARVAKATGDGLPQDGWGTNRPVGTPCRVWRPANCLSSQPEEDHDGAAQGK